MIIPQHPNCPKFYGHTEKREKKACGEREKHIEGTKAELRQLNYL